MARRDPLRETAIECARRDAGEIMQAAEDVPIGARGDFKDGAVLRRLAGFKAWVNADHPVRANEIIGVYVDALQARLIGLHQIQLDYLAKNT